MFEFTGKAVMITGEAQDFGRVLSVAFAERGARLALCDIDDQGGGKTLGQVRAGQAWRLGMLALPETVTDR